MIEAGIRREISEAGIDKKYTMYAIAIMFKYNYCDIIMGVSNYYW